MTASVLPAQITTMRIGELALVVGVLLFLWGIKWDGRHWWDKRWFSLAAWCPRRGLYVGNILVSDTLLNLDHFLDLTIRAYNGTSQTITYGGCSGSVRVDFANTPGGFQLQPPSFMSGDVPCPLGGELMLSFHLVFTPSQVADFRAMQAAGATPQIMFSGFTISINRRWGQSLRLPVWDGVSLQGALVGGRIHCATGHASSRASATLGGT